jgi:hypothetical protein
MSTKMKHIATGRGRREDRQKQAAARVAEYRSLSVKERITLVIARQASNPGKSLRELSRLSEALAAQSQA